MSGAILLVLTACEANKDNVGDSGDLPTNTGPAWTSVSVAYYNGCGLSSTAKIACWGPYDEFGTNTTPDGDFSEVGLLIGACALSVDGEPVCWGESWEDVAAPSGPLHGLSVGYATACALDAQDALACWGPDDEPEVPPTGKFLQVGAGTDVFCAITPELGVACWGGDMRIVANAPADTGYIQVSCGEQSCCAVKEDGSAECWDDEQPSALPNFTGPLAQVAVDGTFNVGEYLALTCGLAIDGTFIECWDDDNYAYDAYLYTPPEGTWVQVSTGLSTAAGLTSTGEIQYLYGFGAEVPDRP